MTKTLEYLRVNFLLNVLFFKILSRNTDFTGGVFFFKSYNNTSSLSNLHRDFRTMQHTVSVGPKTPVVLPSFSSYFVLLHLKLRNVYLNLKKWKLSVPPNDVFLQLLHKFSRIAKKPLLILESDYLTLKNDTRAIRRVICLIFLCSRDLIFWSNLPNFTWLPLNYVLLYHISILKTILVIID